MEEDHLATVDLLSEIRGHDSAANRFHLIGVNSLFALW